MSSSDGEPPLCRELVCNYSMLSLITGPYIIKTEVPAKQISEWTVPAVIHRLDLKRLAAVVSFLHVTPQHKNNVQRVSE